jgi:hypothetical protein
MVIGQRQPVSLTADWAHLSVRGKFLQYVVSGEWCLDARTGLFQLTCLPERVETRDAPAT